GTLDNILANIERVAGAKKQENLRALPERLEMCRKLITLDRNVPVTIDWEAWRLGEWHGERLLGLFQDWGFHRFSDQVRSQLRAGEVKQGSLFGEEPEPAAPAEAEQPKPRVRAKWQATYHLVNTPEQFQAFFQELKKQKRFAIDLETNGLEPRSSDIVGYAITWKAGEAWYLAVRGPAGEPVLDPDQTL